MYGHYTVYMQGTILKGLWWLKKYIYYVKIVLNMMENTIPVPDKHSGNTKKSVIGNYFLRKSYRIHIVICKHIVHFM